MRIARRLFEELVEEFLKALYSADSLENSWSNKRVETATVMTADAVDELGAAARLNHKATCLTKSANDNAQLIEAHNLRVGHYNTLLECGN